MISVCNVPVLEAAPQHEQPCVSARGAQHLLGARRPQAGQSCLGKRRMGRMQCYK